MSKVPLTLENIKRNLERFCAYQERCHAEIVTKLFLLGVHPTEHDQVLGHLIQNNFLNEERFARSFARGKHRIKGWGKNRIVNELKNRNITAYNIKAALQELDDKDYDDSFHLMAEKVWTGIRESERLKKRKKFCDYFLRKGFESDLIYEKVIELEKNESANR